MFKPQLKHKAMHCGYKKRPSKQNINSTLLMYKESNNTLKEMRLINEIPNGTQLTLSI